MPHRMKGSRFTMKQQDAINALVSAKPGETVGEIAKRAGQNRDAIHKDLLIPELVAAVEAGRRKKEKIGRTSLEGAKKGVEALHTILVRLTSKMDEGEEVTDVEVAKVMQLTTALFNVASKVQELGLDVDVELNSAELEQDATQEIGAAIKFGMALMLLPPEIQEERYLLALEQFKKKGTITNLEPPQIPLPPQYGSLPEPTELPEPELLYSLCEEEPSLLPVPVLMIESNTGE